LNKLNVVPEYSQPYPFWFWNGIIEHGEVRRQISLLAEAGITEFVVHARTGLKTPFLSDAWFDAFGVAVEEARRRNMRCWIYDEYNWPSGTAGATITRDTSKREHFIAADGSLCTENGKHHGPLSVDYLNPACTDQFIAKCYQSYFDRFSSDFGKTIPGFFNDEARFCNPQPWSPSLDEPYPVSGAYARLGGLFAQNYFRRIRSWCDEHRALFTGHVMGEETLGSQVRFMGDAWSTIDAYNWAGVDHLGSACWGNHVRFAASIAHLRGETALTCETFAGCPWNISPQDLYRIAGWLYANGVTRILFHGFFYTREGEAQYDWPPDLFFRWDGWQQMPSFIEWASRIQHFLDRSRPVADVAIYYPLAEFCSDYTPDLDFKTNFDDTNRVMGETARRYHLEFGRIINELVRRNISFDVVPAHKLDAVKERILIAPYRAEPEFDGRMVQQGERTAEAAADELDRLLEERPQIIGERCEPRPRAVSDCISDPYMHEGRDEGGVLLRRMIFENRPAMLIWNANSHQFTGSVRVPERRTWIVWDPRDGSTNEQKGDISLSLGQHSMRICLAAD